MTRSLVWSSSSSRAVAAAFCVWRVVGGAAPGRDAVERVAVKDCLDVLGTGAAAGAGVCTASSSRGLPSSLSRDSASVGPSDGPLVPVSPASEAFAEATWSNEGRLDRPAAETVLCDPGLDVLVGPDTDGRDVLEATGWAPGWLIEDLAVEASRGRLDATVEVREAPPIDERLEGATEEDNCFVGDFVGDYII
jgi:hypothetical protein